MIFVLILALLLSGAAPAWCEAESPDMYILSTGGSAALVTAEGAIAIGPGRYSALAALGDSGLYAATPQGGTLMGLIDASGEALTAFDMSYAAWDGGAVIFTRDGLTGVMSPAGDVLIPAAYTRLVYAGDGGYLALKTDPWDDLPDAVYHVTRDGAETASGVTVSGGLEAFSEGLMPYMDTLGRYGYIGEDGQTALDPLYAWAGPFIDECAVVAAAEGGFGLIDGNGNWLAEPVYERIERQRFPGAPVLAVYEGGAVLMNPADGAEIARFTGDKVDAVFSGSAVLLTLDGQMALVDYEGKTLYPAPDNVEWMSARAGFVVLQRDQSDEAPFSFVTPKGEVVGAWQGLRFAGVYDGRAYFIAMTYRTTRMDYASMDMVFYDEIEGTRYYSLIDDEGRTVSSGYTNLTRTGRALLTAETDNWIGLIRPDGEIVARLEKEE